MSDIEMKTCFVIAPIGEPDSDTRRRSDQVMRHIIKPAVGSAYEAIRADDIAEPGLITNQVIHHVVNDPLVIADLTEQNPNVFYELAVRHISRKPIVQIVHQGHRIPFDVAETRTVFFDLTNPDSVADAREEISKQIRHMEENPADVQSPVSVPLDLLAIRQGDDQEQPRLDDLLSVLSEISDTTTATRREVQSLGSLAQRSRGQNDLNQGSIIRRLASHTNSPYAFLVLVSTFRWTVPWVYEFGMEAYKQVTEGNAGIAREVLQELEHFAKPLAGSLHHPTEQVIVDLNNLLERFIEHTQQNGFGVDDLPF